MSKIKIRPYDTAEYLETREDIYDYLQIALEDGDPQLITTALGNAARAYGMLKLAKETGLNRENLYRSLSGEKEPKFITIAKVADSLGFKITFQPKTPSNSQAMY